MLPIIYFNFIPMFGMSIISQIISIYIYKMRMGKGYNRIGDVINLVH